MVWPFSLRGSREMSRAPLAIEAANFRAVDARMQSGVDSPLRGNKLQTWASYDYANPDFNGGLSNTSSDQNTISVGGDMKLSSEVLLGLQFGYTQNKGDFGGGGSAQHPQPMTHVVGGDIEVQKQLDCPGKCGRRRGVPVGPAQH